jgi:hypothetical protein
MRREFASRLGVNLLLPRDVARPQWVEVRLGIDGILAAF